MYMADTILKLSRVVAPVSVIALVTVKRTMFTLSGDYTDPKTVSTVSVNIMKKIQEMNIFADM